MSKLDIIKSRIIENKEDCLQTLQYWRFKDEKIVFTNGCFDIIHRGHLEYLAKASDMGSKLIIGVNTDLSVRTLKGDTRPIIDEYSRCQLLASLAYVDMVILFGEQTPYELIKYVQPDILVKGSDYNAEDIVGYDIVKAKGGEIKTLDFLEGFSSTKIIDKIKSE